MATLTINTTAQQGARIAEAFGSHLGLNRNATGAEVKQAVIRYVVDVVHSYETEKQAKLAIAGVDKVTPT